MSGLTATGFVTRRLETILLATRGRLAARFGAAFATGGDSVSGGWLAAVLPEIALVWEGMAALYGAINPDQAVGDQLDAIARLYGLTRLGALSSTTTLTLTGTSGTVIPIGSRAGGGTIVVETTELVTIGGGGTITVGARAVVPGAAQVAAVNAIDTILTPVAGWSTISASAALTGGRDEEDDTTLRGRLAQSTSVVASVEGAIRTRLLALPGIGIEAALVTSNRTLTTDSNGTPPKAVRAIISPNLSADAAAELAIATALWRSVPAGIEVTGIGANARTYTIVDQQGISQTVGWEYPTVIPVEYTGDLVVDLTAGPLTSAEVQTLAYDALQAWTDALGVGVDVTPVDVACVLRGAIPGLKRVDSLEINGSPNQLTINFNERASYNVGTVFTVTSA